MIPAEKTFVCAIVCIVLFCLSLPIGEDLVTGLLLGFVFDFTAATYILHPDEEP